MKLHLILLSTFALVAILWVRHQEPYAVTIQELGKYSINGIPLASTRQAAKELLKAPEFRLEIDEPERLVGVVKENYTRVELTYQGQRLIRATGSSLTLDNQRFDMKTSREEIFRRLGEPKFVDSERGFLELEPYRMLHYHPKGISELIFVYQGVQMIGLEVTL
jgi:hypothetical protein